MKKPEITPGKWAAEFGGLPGVFAGFNLIATMESRKQRENDANATAIAALPDLLEALERFTTVCDTAPPVEFLQHISEANKQARQSLTKAGYTFD